MGHVLGLSGEHLQAKWSHTSAPLPRGIHHIQWGDVAFHIEYFLEKGLKKEW